jgi:hypothetical protein
VQDEGRGVGCISLGRRVVNGSTTKVNEAELGSGLVSFELLVVSRTGQVRSKESINMANTQDAIALDID